MRSECVPCRMLQNTGHSLENYARHISNHDTKNRASVTDGSSNSLEQGWTEFPRGLFFLIWHRHVRHFLFSSHFFSHLFICHRTDLTIPLFQQVHLPIILCIHKKRLLPLTRAISCTLHLQFLTSHFRMCSTCLVKARCSSGGH